jgi:Tol biopolymer transport system component
MGLVGAWAPDGRGMLFNDLSIASERPFAKVFLADFDTGTVSPALGESFTEADYSIPAWSPNGEWLAVSLRLAEGAPNEQLWLMRPDGTDARQITTGANYTYGRYQWDPWGESLVFQRLELGIPYPVPQVMVWSRDGGEPRLLAADATWPAWAP